MKNRLGNIAKGFKGIGKSAKGFAKKKGSLVLTILGALGVVLTALLSSKAGKESEENIKRAKEDKVTEEAEAKGEKADFTKAETIELTRKEKFVARVKAWWKPVVVGGLTIAAIVGSQLINMRQISDIMATASIASTIHEKYVEKTREVVGAEEEEKIAKSVKEETDTLRKRGAVEVVKYVGEGDTKFFDPVSHRYFYATINGVERAIDMLNSEARNGGFDEEGIFFNDIYEQIGISGTKAGAGIGFKILDRHWDTLSLDLSKAKVSRDDGTPYIIMDFKRTPDIYDQDKFEAYGC